MKFKTFIVSLLLSTSLNAIAQDSLSPLEGLKKADISVLKINKYK